jgi:hypothetical protein
MRTSGPVAGDVMTTRRHVPPSRLRYEASHPTVAVHCDVETKARLVALRDATGLPLGALVKQALSVLESDLEAARQAGFAAGFADGRRVGEVAGRAAGVEEGRKAGFAEAVRRYRITYPCSRCGKLIALAVGSEAADDAREAITDAGWHHGECPGGTES